MILDIDVKDAELAHLDERQIAMEIDAILKSMNAENDFVTKKYIEVLVKRRNEQAYKWKSSRNKDDRKRFKDLYNQAVKELKEAIIAGKQ